MKYAVLAVPLLVAASVALAQTPNMPGVDYEKQVLGDRVVAEVGRNIATEAQNRQLQAQVKAQEGQIKELQDQKTKLEQEATRKGAAAQMSQGPSTH